MKQNQQIPVDKVTKPIQLLAAWLTGLILIDSAFLTAANTLSSPEWAKGLLIIAAVANVPAFLLAIFLLQTKFRPEMQEDAFYSKYLESKTGMQKQPVTNNQLSKLKEELFSANTQSLELIGNLQNEIKSLSFQVENGEAKVISTPESFDLDQKIQMATNSSAWNQYTIRLNNFLSNKIEFKRCLVEANIPIHNTFGTHKIPFPNPPVVVIGKGFDLEHLRTLLNALSKQDISKVAFAYPENYAEFEDRDEFNREVLIGAYNSHHYGLTIRDAVELINRDNINIEVFYSAIKH